jgi:hypothetical protein
MLGKTVIIKIAYWGLIGGLALSTQACAKKSFESLNKNTVSGQNGGSNNGNGTGGNGSGNNSGGNGNGNGSGGSGNGSNSGGSGTGNNSGGNGNGSNSGGASTNGGSTNGGSTNGGSSNGSSTNGGSNNGSNSGGSSTNGGSTSGGSTNGGSTSGGSTSGGSSSGGSCNPFDPKCTPDGKFCVTEKYQQPGAQITRKLDVWIVTDTSASMDDEREQLANGITNYIAQLPANTDVQFAVSLAHGPTSWFSGRLYKSDFGPGSPEKYVISSKDYNNSQIQYWVRRKLLYSQCKTATNGSQNCYNYDQRSFDNNGNLTGYGFRTLPQDYDAGGGEAGLYTVHEAIRPYPGETPRYTSIQNLGSTAGERGFFREDAALAIIFISDENDICTIDTDPGSHNDPQGKEAVFRGKYCSGVSAQSVLKRLQVIRKSLPLNISSIIYNDRSKVPAGLENGVGYGYNHIANYAGGTIIDITKNSIPAGLSTIGALTSTRLDLRYEFILKYINVDSSTIKVKVDNTTRTHSYSSTTNTVHLGYAGGANSLVDIYYCLRPRERMEPYNIQISSHLINTCKKTYQPDVTVEEK